MSDFIREISLIGEEKFNKLIELSKSSVSIEKSNKQAVKQIENICFNTYKNPIYGKFFF